MPTVLITDDLSPAGIEALKRAGLEVDIRKKPKPEEVREALRTADGIIIRSATTLTPELLKDQPRVKAIVRAGVGVDNIDIPAATREGIVVMNTPAGNTTSTAEHTIAMLMALSRNIAAASASMKAGKWDRKSFTGTQLSGKTLGIIGLGRIGMSVARRAMGLEMKIIGFDPYLTAERAAGLGIEVAKSVDDVCAACDFLTVHTNLSDETRGLINAERLAKMRKGARIINCARGGIVDENALADAIESGHIAGAAFDVFVKEPPEDWRLAQLPGVVTTPHLGASTEEAQESVALEAAEIMSGFLLRNEVRHAVNLAPISAAEMADMHAYLDLGRRLGLLLAQLNHSGSVKSAHMTYRGEAAGKNTRLISSAFASGLMESSFDETVNLVNAEMLAKERGIEITESKTSETGDFSTLVAASIVTADGELTAAGTIFGKQFLRLVRVGPFNLDGYLDGLLLIYRHRDVPGLIGFIGTEFGRHKVNIAHMALGREEQGGAALAVFNLDSMPPDDAIAAVKKHPEVTSLELVKLPKAGEPLPWLGAR